MEAVVERAALDLDALAVSDRFRLFNFTRRDDHVTYLWILRAVDRRREVHQVQVGAHEVESTLRELAAHHPDAPIMDAPGLRRRLDELATDGVVHRFDDASRAGSLAGYRNRQSVYQFSELGYRAYRAVEGVLGARVEDVNLSRLVFSDVLEDLGALTEANRTGRVEDVYRRLSRLDSVMEDMGRRSAQFHVTLGEILRSTEASPEVFLRHKNALLVHMSDFMAELDRHLPRLDRAVHEVEATGLTTLLSRAADADERLFMDRSERLEDWHRRWRALRAWFATEGGTPTRAAELGQATRSAVSGVVALLRQITEAQRGGVNRSTQLRHLAAWVFDTPDDGAAHALMGAAFNTRSARHLAWPTRTATSSPPPIPGTTPPGWRSRSPCSATTDRPPRACPSRSAGTGAPAPNCAAANARTARPNAPPRDAWSRTARTSASWTTATPGSCCDWSPRPWNPGPWSPDA